MIPVPTSEVSRTLRRLADELDRAQAAGDVEAARAALQEFAELGSQTWVRLQHQKLVRDAGVTAANFAEGFINRIFEKAGFLPKPPAKRRTR